MCPDILGFFLYTLHDADFGYTKLGTSLTSMAISKTITKIIEFYQKPAVQALAQSQRFEAPHSIETLAKMTTPILQIGNTCGEGWFLTAEMLELIESGVDNILCLQPFACLPNHVTGKGMIKKIRELHPEANIAPIDYDPGASEVNQLNRIKLMLSVAFKKIHAQTEIIPFDEDVIVAG